MKAVIFSADDAVLHDVPIPEPGDDEILVKNWAISSNPQDWKILEADPNYTQIEGNDVAGEVVKIGKNVKTFGVGDRVAGISVIKKAAKYGGYAEYAVVPADTAFHVGAGKSFQEASTLPLAYMKAALGLFRNLGLPPPGQQKEGSGTSVLVYGGTTAVGVYAIQLAKLANLHVVAVASGDDHASSYGADEVIDDRNRTDSQLVDDIASAANGQIHHVFDAVVEGGTIEIIVSVLEKTGGGKYTTVLPESKNIRKVPGVTSAGSAMVSVVQSDPEAARFATKWYKQLGVWFEVGKFRPQHIEIVPNGLAGVKDGLKRLKANEVRAAKLVYSIADTPLSLYGGVS